MSSNLKKFYENRVKKPELFTYDDAGNLIEKNKEGSVVKTIALPTYRVPTLEEYDEMDKVRMDAIAEATKQYENAREELRKAHDTPSTPKSEILRLNKKVAEADILLQTARFPLKYVKVEKSIPVNKIMFEDVYEVRKMPTPLSVFVTRPYTLQEQYVRIGEEAPVLLKTTEEILVPKRKKLPVILFEDTDTPMYGFLSLKWPVDMEFNATMYSSAYQGVMAELAKAFNDEDHLQEIMTAESADDITYSLEDVPGEPSVNETKWNDKMKELLLDINYQKFKQFPELAGKLLDTKNAVLGAYEPDDNLIGIGISIDDVNAKTQSKWTGQNLLGKALMDIRTRLQQERTVEAQAKQAELLQPQVQASQQTQSQAQPIPQRRVMKRPVFIES